MICFPLDNTGYTADALGAWFGTRTRGVFSADTNFSVTSNNDLSVTVGSGLGWLKADEYWGTVVYEKDAQVLNIDLSDGALQRCDMVCLRLDKNMNEAQLVIKKGTYSQNAVYPPIARNADYDEIYLAAIKVKAGATAITQSDITDLRLNETYCGVMRDGVTGIPTEELYAQWQSWFEQNSENAQNTFTDWFNHIKDQLSTDAAGNLQNQIDGVKALTVAMIATPTVVEASRTGVSLSVTQDSFTLADKVQIILYINEDIITPSSYPQRYNYSLDINNSGALPIVSLDTGGFNSDLPKGTLLYLIYSEARGAFVSQIPDTVENSKSLGGFAAENYPRLDIANDFSGSNRFTKGMNIGPASAKASIICGGEGQMNINSSDQTYGRLFLGYSGGVWILCPVSNGGTGLGALYNRWGQIYSTNSVITTSDRNEKNDIEELEDEFVIAFVEKLVPKSYKLKDGTSGRTHFGFIAQDVEDTLIALGMKTDDFAGLIKSPKLEEYMEQDKDGNDVVKYREVEGEYIYGLRYEEFISIIVRYTQIISAREKQNTKQTEQNTKEIKEIKKLLKIKE